METNFVAWADLDISMPDVNHRSLVLLNDGKNYGFKRLANLIEKYL